MNECLSILSISISPNPFLGISPLLKFRQEEIVSACRAVANITVPPNPQSQQRKEKAMSRLATLALLAAAPLPGALAWGAMGHEAVAYVASNFVSATTKSYFQSLLGDASADYLATVSTWADSYRYTTAGKFSAPYHYIDANDSPPSACGVSYSRDCGAEGCVVSALQNYTTILLDGRYSAANRQIAAKVRYGKIPLSRGLRARARMEALGDGLGTD